MPRETDQNSNSFDLSLPTGDCLVKLIKHANDNPGNSKMSFVYLLIEVVIVTTEEEMKNIKKYGSLSKKILKNCFINCERIGNMISSEYNKKQRESGEKLISEGDRLFLLFFKEWTDLLYGATILCENNLHRTATPTVRTMYEVFLLINYLFIDDEMDLKARCYMVFAAWKSVQETRKNSIYIHSHPDTAINNIYNPEKNYKIACTIFEDFASDEGTKLVKNAIEELDSKFKGKFYGNWYTVYEHLKNDKVTYFSLRQISKKLNRILNNDLFNEDGIMFLYDQLYNNMSQYAHGSSFGDRVENDDKGEFYTPRDYPKNGFLMIVLVQTMFFEILVLISRNYFFGKDGEWNSIEKLNISKINDIQYKTIEKLRELDLKLI